MFRIDARHLTAVSAALKERFTNLSVAETIKLSSKILDAVADVEREKNGAEVGDIDLDASLFGTRPDNALTITEVQAKNVERANRWHGGNFHSWSGLEWAGAMCGEAGEAANVAKKLKRLEDEIDGNAWSERKLDRDQLLTALGGEAADTFLYLCLLCSRYGVNLATAVRAKFNGKSEEMGFPERL